MEAVYISLAKNLRNVLENNLTNYSLVQVLIMNAKHHLLPANLSYVTDAIRLPCVDIP